jgi:hypothetical protein
MSEQLLSTEQMAYFCDEGFLRFDAVIPPALCRGLLAELDLGTLGQPRIDHPYNRPLAGMLQGGWRGTAMAAILQLPQVRGLVTSLVGAEPLYDHHVNHVRDAHAFLPQSGGGSIHQDFAVDIRPYTFDINLSIYPHAVTPDMGGTLLVPGSHFRRPPDNNHYRYQHMRGSVKVSCPAGTIVAWHGALWHAGRPNRTDTPRTMLKLRLNPVAPQVLLWDISDIDTCDPFPILRRGQAWMSNHLVEYMQRARFWRYLSGNPAYDFEGCLTRIGLAFDADRNDPRYRIPAYDAIPRAVTPNRQGAPVPV